MGQRQESRQDEPYRLLGLPGQREHRHHERGQEDQGEASLQAGETATHAPKTATNIVEKSRKPTIPCSTSTDRKELCATRGCPAQGLTAVSEARRTVADQRFLGEGLHPRPPDPNAAAELASSTSAPVRRQPLDEVWGTYAHRERAGEDQQRDRYRTPPRQTARSWSRARSASATMVAMHTAAGAGQADSDHSHR